MNLSNKMVIEIAPIGEYHVLDEHGFIVNPCAKRHITGIWADATADLVSMYQSIHGDNLHSIYLRGSVPRGMMVKSISDLDSLCLVKRTFDKLNTERREAEAAEHFVQKYPQINGVEFDSNIRNIALKSDYIKFLLKTQSLCIWGDDVTKNIASMKISVDSMGTCFHLQKINENFANELEVLSSASELNELCSWLFKAALRSAFEIVMLREMRYTRDLYLCWKSYSKYYPRNKDDMRKALDYAINPTHDTVQIAALWPLVFEFLHSSVENEEHLLTT